MTSLIAADQRASKWIEQTKNRFSKNLGFGTLVEAVLWTEHPADAAKQVERVAEIEAVIDVDLAAVENTRLKWNNLRTEINTFTHRAIAKVQEWRPNEGPTQIFLLGPLFPTSFLKDSRGGMRGSKQYFDIQI